VTIRNFTHDTIFIWIKNKTVIKYGIYAVVLNTHSGKIGKNTFTGLHIMINLFQPYINILVIFSYLASLPPQLEERLAQSGFAVRPV
jgi:hypothetical protein